MNSPHIVIWLTSQYEIIIQSSVEVKRYVYTLFIGIRWIFTVNWRYLSSKMYWMSFWRPLVSSLIFVLHNILNICIQWCCRCERADIHLAMECHIVMKYGEFFNRFCIDRSRWDEILLLSVINLIYTNRIIDMKE